MDGLMEVGRVVGLIALVWFALVGWKLLPLLRGPLAPRADRNRSRGEQTTLGGT